MEKNVATPSNDMVEAYFALSTAGTLMPQPEHGVPVSHTNRVGPLFSRFQIAS
jgi:hypothetical protein